MGFTHFRLPFIKNPNAGDFLMAGGVFRQKLLNVPQVVPDTALQVNESRAALLSAPPS
jgi:hypothetical protein